MKKINAIFNLIIIASFTIFIIGCNGSEPKSIEDQDIDIIDNSEHTKKVRKIFYNVPSPIEMASLIQRSGALYLPELLNNPDNSDKYLTMTKKALNLGAYGTDLSYVRLFDQISLSIKYLHSIRNLSEELNIPEAHGSMALNRLERNINNRDSILQIISETYAVTDSYLKENDRGNTATLIILGGWIEALYIATHIVNDGVKKNNEIIMRIGEQKFSLNNLIELIKTYPEDSDLQNFIPILEDLRTSFNKVDITYTPTTILTDETERTTTINSESSINISEEVLNEIKIKITEIRNSIIK